MKTYTNLEILEFLRKNSIMNIAVNAGDKPLSSVVLFAVDDDFTFYFASHSGSFKVKALKDSKKISFTVWQHLEMLFQADGSVEVATQDQIVEIVDKLAESTARLDDFWPPILSLVSDEYTTFIIKPTWIRVLDMSDLKIGEGLNNYQNVEI